MITVGSLFAGIGGLDLGMARAGMEIKWQVEIDKWCRSVLAKNFPNAERFADVNAWIALDKRDPRRIWRDRWRVGCIVSGFPCQPVSCAGKGCGDADPRWMWPQLRRVLAVLRPQWAVVENVPGLLSAHAGRLFGEVVRDLAALGYRVEWDCISAASVGAPHIRDRVFIVAHTNGVGMDLERWRFAGPRGEGTVLAGGNGEIRKVAYTDRGRQQ